LGFDVCWATTDVSTLEGQSVVRFLRLFIDVIDPAEGFVDVQTQIPGGFDVV
jgi:hypothetical protein